MNSYETLIADEDRLTTRAQNVLLSEHARAYVGELLTMGDLLKIDNDKLRCLRGLGSLTLKNINAVRLLYANDLGPVCLQTSSNPNVAPTHNPVVVSRDAWNRMTSLEQSAVHLCYGAGYSRCYSVDAVARLLGVSGLDVLETISRATIKLHSPKFVNEVATVAECDQPDLASG